MPDILLKEIFTVDVKLSSIPLAMPGAASENKKSRIGDDEIKAMNRVVLSDLLAKANVLQLFESQDFRFEASKKRTRVARPKLVRFTISLSDEEFEEIIGFKKRIAGLGGKVKSSELVRGGLALLATLDETDLKTVLKHANRTKN